MRKFILVFMSLALITNLALAEEVPAQKSRKGQTALLFTVAGLGDFGVSGHVLGVAVPTTSTSSEKLAGLGLKYYMSERLAVRASLVVAYTRTEEEAPTETSKSSVYTIGVAPGFEYHFINTKTISTYWGARAAFGLYKSTTPGYFSGFGPVPERTFSGNVISAAFLLGAEIFPIDNVSLGAEYQVGADYTYGKLDSGETSSDIPKKLRFGIGAVAVTFAVYW